MINQNSFIRTLKVIKTFAGRVFIFCDACLPELEYLAQP